MLCRGGLALRIVFNVRTKVRLINLHLYWTVLAGGGGVMMDMANLVCLRAPQGHGQFKHQWADALGELGRAGLVAQLRHSGEQRGEVLGGFHRMIPEFF